jgi:hypothetical protein
VSAYHRAYLGLTLGLSRGNDLWTRVKYHPGIYRANCLSVSLLASETVPVQGAVQGTLQGATLATFVAAVYNMSVIAVCVHVPARAEVNTAWAASTGM